MIELKNVSVTYSGGWFQESVSALNTCSLTVNTGDIFGLLGPNGAGKSTALYVLLGLIVPDTGQVQVFGERPVPGSALFDRIGYLPETPDYPTYLTLEEGLEFYTSLYNQPASKSKINRILDFLNLHGAKDRRLEKCSKGMKQKFGLAICLLQKLDLLFLDEPTRGLDPVMRRNIREALLELNQNGTTIFLNSHVLSEVELLCNQVGIIQNGSVSTTKSIQELRNETGSTYRVVTQPLPDPPDYLDVQQKQRDRHVGILPKEILTDFCEYMEQNNLHLYECTLNKINLEDALLDELDSIDQ